MTTSLICQMCKKVGRFFFATDEEAFVGHMRITHGVTITADDIRGLEPCAECNRPLSWHSRTDRDHEFKRHCAA